MERAKAPAALSGHLFSMPPAWPEVYDFLFGWFLGVEIPDLPCGTVIHLRAIEQSDYKVSIIEMGFTTGEFPLLSMAIMIADMASNLASEF
jgi:hypothetical protein